MATLRYLDDAGQLEMKLLDSEHFVIGRAPSCQLSFESDMISREHLRIDLDTDGRFRIRDLGSRNKTYVNGELITETLLNPGDIVRVGDRVLEFLDDTVAGEKVDLEFLTPDQSEPSNCEWVKIKHPVSLTIGQLERLSQVGADQPLTARSEDIAGSALGQIILDLRADRGFIALRGEARTELQPLAQRALRRPPSGSLTPVSQAFCSTPVLQQVAGRYPQTAKQLNTKIGFAITALTAPLTFRGEVVGILYVDRPTAKKPFTSTDLQYAVAAGARIGSLIGESARKLVRSAAREGAAWMSTIRRVQAALTIPVRSSDSFDVAVKSFPGRVRCGDFADVVHIDEQRCCLVVIDGGGHGISGIAQAGAIQAAIRSALAVSEDALMDPAGMFNVVNQIVASSSARQVLSCVYAGVDMAAGRLAYINAGGMSPLLMVGPGRLLTLDQHSLVLGVDRDYIYEATRADLPETFRLVCYTDGLAEVTSAGGDVLGEQRLHEGLLDRDAFGGVGDVLSRIEKTWSTHLAGAQPDDDALVVVLGRGWVSK